MAKGRGKRLFILRPLFLIPAIFVIGLLALAIWWPFEPGVSWVLALALSPDGRRIAAAENTEVRVWDAADPSRVQILTGHERAVAALGFHPRRDILAGTDDLGRVLLWDLEAGTMISDMSFGSAGSVQGIAFSPDGNSLLGLAGFLPPEGAAPFPDPGVRIEDLDWEGMAPQLSGKHFWLGAREHYRGGRLEFWDVRENGPIGRMRIEEEAESAAVTSFAFNSEALVLAYGTTSGRIGFWDLRGSAMLRSIDLDPNTPSAAAGGVAIRCLAFNDDGDVLAATTGRRLLVWTLDDMKLVREIDLRKGPSDRLAVSLALDPGGTTVFLGFSDGRVERWDLEKSARRSVYDFLGGFKRTLETVTRILKS
jgi:WD40 repeat protein